ncbi:MAG: S-layer homology domain-containing protein [Ruminococcaceae bacterium]|nr:S-layer homology domain-containing protein [Oscillospiraceae bacterium]
MKKVWSVCLACLLICMTATAVLADEAALNGNDEVLVSAETGKESAEPAGVAEIAETAEAKEATELPQSDALTLKSLFNIKRADAVSITFSKGERSYTSEEASVIDLFFEFADKIALNGPAESRILEEGGYHVLIETIDGTTKSVYVAPDGGVDLFDMDKVTEEHPGTYSAAEPQMLFEYMKIFMPEEEAIYTLSFWAYDDFQAAVSAGLFVPQNLGISDYTLPISREKFCDIAVSMIEAKNGAEPEAEGSWQSPDFIDTDNVNVRKLYEAGIVLGRENTATGVIFAPDDFITREEVATILYRMAKVLKMELPQTAYVEGVPFYQDKADIADWAFEGVFMMRELAIMEGVDEAEFAPKNTYTAEQAVVTMLRMYNSLAAVVAE